MTVDHLGPEAVAACATVEDAVRLMRGRQDHAVTGVVTKADASPATIADFALQAVIAARLADRFPDDPLVAEEGAAALAAGGAEALLSSVVDLARTAVPGASAPDVLAWIDRGNAPCAARFWTLDPIDGTKGLLRGGQYVTALALIVDGLVQVGVIGCPLLTLTPAAAPSADAAHAVYEPGTAGSSGGLAIAVRGRGAWWQPLGQPHLFALRSSAESDPTRARALHSVERRHGNVERLHRVMALIGSAAPPVLMDSQAKHVLLAAGAAEVLMRDPPDPAYREAIWDQAAGSLLIEEAGGRVSDVNGRRLDFTTGRRLERNTGVLATAAPLHDAVIEAVRRTASPPPVSS